MQGAEKQNNISSISFDLARQQSCRKDGRADKLESLLKFGCASLIELDRTECDEAIAPDARRYSYYTLVSPIPWY
jgi:hypothetical protein